MFNAVTASEQSPMPVAGIPVIIALQFELVLVLPKWMLTGLDVSLRVRQTDSSCDSQTV